MTETKAVLSKWIRILLLCQMAELLTEVLNRFDVLGGVTVWVSRAAAVGVIVALLRLAPANLRYRKAAVFYTMALVGALALRLTVLVLVLPVFSLIADHRQFGAHAELVAPQNEVLARRWHGLFYWKLFGVLLAAAVGMIPGVILALAGKPTDVAVSIATGCAAAAQLALEAVHAWYLKRTLACVEE